MSVLVDGRLHCAVLLLHVEVIHSELHLLFISDPVLCQLDAHRPGDVWIHRICCKESLFDLALFQLL